MGSYSKKSSRILTLNTVQELRDVTFGHRFPRHGLKLLHWLANEIVEFGTSGRMRAQQNPDNGAFGFHPFHNSEGILPRLPSKRKYFEVGNLHKPGAGSLPFGQDQPESSESNTDRIILSLDSRMMIDAVYITEHKPHKLQFSGKDTFHLSSNLIWSIKGDPLEDFLKQAGYVPGTNNSVSISISEESSDEFSKDEGDEIVLLGEYSNQRYKPRAQQDSCDDCTCCCIIL